MVPLLRPTFEEEVGSHGPSSPSIGIGSGLPRALSFTILETQGQHRIEINVVFLMVPEKYLEEFAYSDL